MAMGTDLSVGNRCGVISPDGSYGCTRMAGHVGRGPCCNRAAGAEWCGPCDAYNCAHLNRVVGETIEIAAHA